MLVLFETPAGYALFKCLDDSKLSSVDEVGKYFETEAEANSAVKLKAFSKFESTAQALEAANDLVEGNLADGLKSFLKAELKAADLKDTLAVADPKLGKSISKKLNIQVISDSLTMELMRGIRSQLSTLLVGVSDAEYNTMALGLSHSMSRYKLKFSPDKVDTMIIQAIALLDDLDKELNTYAMRLKEWYGWHFPELTKILVDNVAFARVIRKIGFRTNCSSTSLAELLPEELEEEIKSVAEISMGTEISEDDLSNICHLADQVISLSEYRAELYEYLKNRMLAIAPNLTALVGELVGARLISHAGSLMSLAKHPASTIQILGAEKALFRALKAKQNTPKYGLIFHASLIGQAGPKLKGKIARVLAAKAALSIRFDALADPTSNETATGEMGLADRVKVEHRLRQLENRSATHALGSARGKAGANKKYEFVSSKSYNPAADMTGSAPAPKEDKKRKVEERETVPQKESESKKAKHEETAESEKDSKLKKEKKSKEDKKDKEETKPEKKDKEEKKKGKRAKEEEEEEKKPEKKTKEEKSEKKTKEEKPEKKEKKEKKDKK